MMSNLDRFREAMYKLHVAVTAMHTDAKVEVQLDPAVKYHIDGESFRERYEKGYHNACTEYESGGRVSHMYGIKIGVKDHG